MAIEGDEILDSRLEEEEIIEAAIPPELIAALHFDEYQRTIKPHFSMQFVFNGTPYHFDGVVTALANAHKKNMTAELEKLAAVPGVVVRLCHNFTGVQKEYYKPSELVSDSASWVRVADENEL